MLRCLVLTALLLPAFAFGQSKKSPRSITPPPNLKEMAIQESTITESGVVSDKASEVDVSETGYLTLKDPGLSESASPWRWLVAFRLQNFSPSGSAEMRNGQRLELGDVGSLVVPFLEIGTLYQLQPSERASWKVGGSLEGGTSSRGTSVTFPSGQQAPDSRLSTNFTAASLVGLYQHPQATRWEGLLGWTEGIATYSHTSDNDGANFSESARYGGWRLGVSYRPGRRWTLGIEQSQRTTRSQEGIKLPSDNTSFSMRVVW